MQQQLEHLHRLVGPAWGERTPLCTSLAKHWSDTRQQKYTKMFLERQLYLSFLLPCSWICCWSVYIAFLPLRFSFWLLVGSTSLVPVGPFLLHAVLAVDMLQCDESEIKWEIEWNWSLKIGTFSKRSSPRDKFPPILLDPRLALPIPEATKAKVIWIQGAEKISSNFQFIWAWLT